MAAIRLQLGFGLFYIVLDFKMVIMFLIGFVSLGVILTIAAGKPDMRKGHF